MDQLLSIEKAAEQLGGLSTWTVRSWLTKGRFTRVKIGRRTMIRQSEIQAFINDQPQVKRTLKQ